MIKEKIIELLTKSVREIGHAEIVPHVGYAPLGFGADYSTNIAMAIGKNTGQDPMGIASQISDKLLSSGADLFSSINAVKPGFINIRLKDDYLFQFVTKNPISKSFQTPLKDKKIMVEYAHPNTHKEMHIGHMRTLVIGEAISRLSEACGAKVFRANYQGDIGLHVAKALFGIQEILKEEKLTTKEVGDWDIYKRARYLGRSYARGDRDYLSNKAEIDNINKGLYLKSANIMPLYELTRQWSLDYYETFYKRFYTKFDRLFFESEVASEGVEVVSKYIGKIFAKENGAVIFPGEKYGLHTRVFITNQGNPTYEGKDMGLGFLQYKVFPFDINIHVVASEQLAYFHVVFKALELIDFDKFKGERHLPMGMVQLKDKKMSSRTGEVLTIDWLLQTVKEQILQLSNAEEGAHSNNADTIEQMVIGAVKYSILKVNPTQDVYFDIEKSVSLDGDSGPYLQYAYARTQSLIEKAEKSDLENKKKNYDKFEAEERSVLRILSRFEEVTYEAASRHSPNILCAYLFELSHTFNLFYQKYPILKAEKKERALRLVLTKHTGEILKRGLFLLGIQSPQRI